MMKILFLNHNVAYRGGATFYRALNLAQRLAQRGHEVDLVSSSAAGIVKFEYACEDRFRLVESPGLMPTRWRHGYDLYDSLRRCGWMRSQSYTIVHTFDSRPTVIYPALAAQKKGAFLMMDWCDWFGRGGAVEERKNPVLRFLLRWIDTYYEEAFRAGAGMNTVINLPLFQRAASLGIPSQKIRLLRNGSDTQKIIPIDPQMARTALGLPEPAMILGYMGALFPTDASLLMEAFQKARSIFPDCRLLLIGNLKIRIPSQPAVIQTGFISPQLLNLALGACDLLLVPQIDSVANRGRWPSKINDYFSAGRPVVITAVGDGADVVTGEKAGIVTDATVDGLTAGIVEMLRRPELRNEMGKNARKLAETTLNWDTIVDDLEKWYREFV